jgi:hypothetical protein
MQTVEKALFTWQKELQNQGRPLGFDLTKEFHSEGIFSDQFTQVKNGEKIDLSLLSKEVQV